MNIKNVFTRVVLQKLLEAFSCKDCVHFETFECSVSGVSIENNELCYEKSNFVIENSSVLSRIDCCMSISRRLIVGLRLYSRIPTSQYLVDLRGR